MKIIYVLVMNPNKLLRILPGAAELTQSFGAQLTI